MNPARTDIFIPMGRLARVGIVLYCIFWVWCPYVISSIMAPSVSDGVTAASIFCFSLIQCALLFPFFRREVGGIAIGWLHPLVFPTLLALGIQLIKDPSVLLGLYRAFSMENLPAEHRAILIYSPQKLAEADLLRLALTLLAQVAYLSAFMYLRPLKGTRQPKTYTVVNKAFRLAVLVLLGVFVWLMINGGGVTAYFSRLAYGRAQAAMDAGGALIILVRALPFVLMLWASANRRLFRSPEFWVLAATSVLAVFLTTGSRSYIFVTLAGFMTVWMLAERKIPAVGGIILLCGGSLLLGTLADLRSSAIHNGGRADFTVLTQVFDVRNAVERTQVNVDANDSVRGDLAIFATVPNSVHHLWGQSYLGAVGFFVPRAIWQDKPRSVGAFVGAVIYDDMPNTTGYLGAGYPAGGVAEAFWNFGVAGVLVVFLAFGAFHKRVTQWFLEAPLDPLRRAMYVTILLMFQEPSSEEFIPIAQITIIVLLVSYFGIRPEKKRVFNN
ncbi:hypothetical protein MCEREM21A_01536 [Sphingomonadaceae bacterium]